jgi:YhcH/YjgK/YiaL family protein
MILDSIEYAAKYETISPAFQAAMRFLAEHRYGGLTEDRYTVSDDVYALVKRYDTKAAENCKYEGHRDYIDIQYVVSGKECIGWAPLPDMKEKEYIESKDQYIMLGEGTLVPLRAQQFMILFHDDIHMPCVVWERSEPVEKIIMKIRRGA